ncbi:hypothetical protein BDK51DRAFT_39082 [Blyttiomyces helicus]|uniref:Sortilin N-terminal domain-containing protein n=1 Tax=Blyttiomyces helicus TaxID=388810 RepID=A0A4P9WEW9_9FUNG|nr:hypothetical protein BDK51DRAFT_39082 [Blyttiomyces helicus]|eukprot:RKO90355.1 hypothetical protein BDK51DRAFT_39082 [Blyttiomyces helicus]
MEDADEDEAVTTYYGGGIGVLRVASVALVSTDVRIRAEGLEPGSPPPGDRPSFHAQMVDGLWSLDLVHTDGGRTKTNVVRESSAPGCQLLGVPRKFRLPFHQRGEALEKIADVKDGDAASVFQHPHAKGSTSKSALSRLLSPFSWPFILTTSAAHYITKDKGQSWKSFKVDASRSLLAKKIMAFNGKEPGCILYTGRACKKDGMWDETCHDEVRVHREWTAQPMPVFAQGPGDSSKYKVIHFDCSKVQDHGLPKLVPVLLPQL